MIGCHQLDARAREHAHAVELTTIGKHLGEPEIVSGGGDRASTAGIISGRRRHVDQFVGLAARWIDRKRLRQPGHLVRRYPEAGIRHAQRLEQPIVEINRNALARGSLNHAPEHIDCQAVFPDGPGPVHERSLGDPLDKLGWRERSRIIIALLVVKPRLGIRLFHRRIDRDLAIGEPGSVAKQVGGSRREAAEQFDVSVN